MQMPCPDRVQTAKTARIYCYCAPPCALCPLDAYEVEKGIGRGRGLIGSSCPSCHRIRCWPGTLASAKGQSTPASCRVDLLELSLSCHGETSSTRTTRWYFRTKNVASQSGGGGCGPPPRHLTVAGNDWTDLEVTCTDRKSLQKTPHALCLNCNSGPPGGENDSADSAGLSQSGRRKWSLEISTQRIPWLQPRDREISTVHLLNQASTCYPERI